MILDRPRGPYALMDGAPQVGDRGLLVGVSFRPAEPATGVPQGIVAHAHDAAGWWIGLTGEGRALVGVGTASGPVSLPVGPPLRPGALVRLHARFPGAAGERLEVELLPEGAEAAAGRAVIGAPLVPAPGSVLWGARALRDRREPEHPFAGDIGDVVMIADRTASPDDLSAEALLGHWAGWIRIDAVRYRADAPVLL